MSTITLPNIRVFSDLTVKVRLKDDGVAIDWSTLSNLRAWIYSDAQSSFAGRCDVTVDGEDATLLVCRYAATRMQYLGVNRIVVSARYMGAAKTYDKPVLNFVRWTEDQAGEQITIEDPEVTVEIDVEDISSSILQEAVDAAFSAAVRADEAAAAAEHMVDIHQGPPGPAGKAPYVDATTGNWFVWDDQTEQYVDSGNPAQGPAGNGIASWSVVESQEDGGSNVVTVVFTNGESESFTVKNGNTGATPNLVMGIVTTGAPGSQAGAQITGTPANPILHLTIPQGEPGVAAVRYVQVDTLPSASSHTLDALYLVPTNTTDVYDVYYTSRDGQTYSWVMLCTTSVQLSDYATKAEVTQLELEVNEKARIVSLVGQGNTGVYTGLSGLEGGHSYRIWIDSWNTDQLTSNWSNLSFYVRYDNNGSYVYLYTISVPVTLPNYADITLPDNVTSIEIGGRINSGATARVRFDDITPLLQGQGVQRKVEYPIANRSINTNNATITSTSSSSGNYCLFIPVREGEQYMIRGEGRNSSVTRLFALYTYDPIGNNYVKGLTFTSYGDFRSSPRYVVIPNGVTHLAVNFANYNSDTDGVWLINGKDERSLPFWEFEFGGMGNYGRPTNLNDLVVKGHTYRLMPNGAWDTAGVTSPNTILGVYIDMSTRISNKLTIGGRTLSKFYDFTIPKDLDLSTHSVDVSARATFGFRASFFLQDITAQEVELFPLSGADGAMATFMDAVQRKSDNIGLTSSTWNNPYGGRLYGFNRTTVSDLLKATIYAAGNPRLMDIMGATETEVRVWGEHARVVTITNDIPAQLATYYQTLHGSVMPYKILANKAGAHANESDLSDNGFSLLVVAIVSGHYVAAVVGIGNTSQSYTSGRNNRVKGMIELLDIVKAHYDGADISGMSVVSCEKAIAAELPSDVFPQCYRKDAITPIHSQDADTIFMPASTSKVMAAITMVDFLEMGDFYRITDNADELVNDSDYTAYAGDVQSVETSFYAMLMASNGANTLSLARIAGEKILNQTTALV